jgi:hypothetical protein
MGPITLFDKSFIQSLSVDESVFFDHFFEPLICPMFFVETLADLEKGVREGRTPEQEVGIIANKVPEMSGVPCAPHIELGAANLLGAFVPIDGRIPPPGGRFVKKDGQFGIVYDQAPEVEAFRRWQNREFLLLERQFAQFWRAALNRIDLTRIANETRSVGISPKSCRSLDDVRGIVEKVFKQSGEGAVDQITVALSMFDVPPQNDLIVFGRWARKGRTSLRRFAPYSDTVLPLNSSFRSRLLLT